MRLWALPMLYTLFLAFSLVFSHLLGFGFVKILQGLFFFPSNAYCFKAYDFYVFRFVNEQAY